MAPGLRKTFSYLNFRESGLILRSLTSTPQPLTASTTTTSSSNTSTSLSSKTTSTITTQRRNFTEPKRSPIRNTRTVLSRSRTRRLSSSSSVESPKVVRAAYFSAPATVFSKYKMRHPNASARLKAIKSHIVPGGNSEQTREYFSSIAGGGGNGRDVDFSVLPCLMPGEEGSTTGDSLWYVVVAAALLAFHHEPGVGQLWRYISGLYGERAGSKTEQEQATIARRIRESCLKSSVLVGFPRVSTFSFHPFILFNPDIIYIEG